MQRARSLLIVWAALLGLLALTVAASYLVTGPLSAAASLLIALAKASLVFWFFMHLREERGLVRLFAVGATAWLLILLLLLAADYATR
jgi:cytochrome c oxidase subunit IV